MITGFSAFKVSRLKERAIPVAKGKIIKFLINFIPIKLSKFWVIAVVNFTKNDDPTALGCNSVTSPDLI